jgi:hypothetical protein
MLSIGIAIPAHYNHVIYLIPLFNLFKKQTIKPDKISVSISSCPNKFILNFNEKDYGFPIQINTTNEKKNQAENRNIAASYLNTDIISFIDADDLPHIQRNEMILEIFESNKDCHAIVHNYENDQNKQDVMLLPIIISRDNIFIDYIDTIIPSTPFPVNSKKHMSYHCAHLSIRRSIFDDVKYNEDWLYFRREDSLYLKDLMIKKNIKITYIIDKLSWYRNSSILKV